MRGCHHIPSVPGARGIVGPRSRVSPRDLCRRRLTNEPANLVAWIRRPRVLDPQTIMPDLAVSERDAQDIAAFLYAASR